MERRKFLKIAGFSTAGMVVLPTVGYSILSLNHAAVGLILQNCSTLKIERSEAERFVVDYYSTYFKKSSPIWKILYKTRMKIYYLTGAKAKEAGLVNLLVRNFLLSSDFFRNKMDESRDVKYVQLYDPYKMPCANPFSNLYYPSQTPV